MALFKKATKFLLLFVLPLGTTALASTSARNSTVGGGSNTAYIVNQATSTINPVDIHNSLEKVRKLKHIKPEQNWLDQLPWLKKTLLDLGQSLQNLIKSLASHIGNAFPKIDSFPGIPSQASQIISNAIAVFIIFLGLLAFYIALRWWKRRLENRQSQVALRSLNKTFDESLLVNAKHHWEQAQLMAERADFSEATRQVYLATLCLLDESQTVPFDETRSNREYHYRLEEANKQDASKNFSQLANRFEQIRYGRHHALAEDFSSASQDYKALSEALNKTLAGMSRRRSKGGYHEQ